MHNTLHRSFESAIDLNILYIFKFSCFIKKSDVGEMVHRIVMHICFPFQMVGNLQIIMLLLFTFALPVNPIDPSKKVFD